ncbi:hypothetical protein HDU92_001163 [Lobulomyces angularis]|nr:hypothetical protein HDU92_001163 [Lobulomyces angularis]
MENSPSVDPSLVAVDHTVVISYFVKLLNLVFDAELDDIKASYENSMETVEICKKFISEPQVSVVFLIKEKTDLPTFNYSAQLELSYSENLASVLAVIKRLPIIEASRTLNSQLQLIVLPTDSSNIYESIHSYIHNAVSPFFDAYVSAKGGLSGTTTSSRDDKDVKAGIPMTKKKIAELELSLLHLQQNVEIPDISLYINPVIQTAIDNCRQNGQRVTVDAVPKDAANDSVFLNKLQGEVNGWIKEIQKVTKLSRDPASGTASQEINFWISMERALSLVEEQLKSDQIVLTLDILKNAKRFHATVSFLADTGLKEASDTVTRYNLLMKEFPINELLSATDVDRIRNSLIQIFGHLNKKYKISPYPVKRALPLVEAISRDLNDQLLKVLGSRRLMYMSYEEFDVATSGCEQVFLTWEDQAKEFTHIARDLTRKRNEKFIPIKITNAHAKLQERINFVRAFRKQHEQLHNTIVKVMRNEKFSEKNNISDSSAGEDVQLAYESVKNVDVLDVSPEGNELWVTAENAYNERVSRVENQIIARLRDRLGTAKNANEMFRVFSKFNALFVRPKIRSAIQEYQNQLIESVKDDIKKLHDKFKLLYRNTQASQMGIVRDLPPVSGAIVWAKQIERQLGLYMNRVEDVLGKGWELYAEGRKLAADSSSFTKKLDTRPIFEAWLSEIQKRDLSISGKVFDVRMNRSISAYQLNVNFDSQIISLFKEVRNLLWLNYQIPHIITNVAKDAKRVYPYAVSLIETVKTYSQTTLNVRKNSVIAPLIAGYHKDVQTLISKGIKLRWDYFVNTYEARSFGINVESNVASETRNVTFVKEFSVAVSIFQDKVNSVLSIYDEINLAVEELKNCPFAKEKFKEIIDKIQGYVDKLNLESYSNLESWSTQLDSRVEAVLISRLQIAIKAWTSEFLLTQDPDQLFMSTTAAINSTTDNSAALSKQRKLRSKRSTLLLTMQMSTSEEMISAMAHAAEQQKKDDRPTVRPIVHEIRIKNQVMFLDPPIEDARLSWYEMLHGWLSNVCDLTRIQSSRYEIGLNINVDNDISYSSVLSKLPFGSLESAYEVIEQKLSDVTAYIKVWLQYQSLWDLDSENVYHLLGEDLNRWQQLVSEIKKARNTFDNSETSKSFGKLIVDYEQVQSKVNAKYDQWQREVINKFGAKLLVSIKNLHSTISKARDDLEKSSEVSSVTSDAVGFIIFVQELKKKVTNWVVDVETYKQGQKTLEKNRYRFPDDWLYVDHLDGEWNAFNTILNKKNQIIQEQIANLQQKIVSEDKIVDQKIRELIGEWDKDKPIQGEIKPDVAINQLSIFEGRLVRLKDDYDQLCRAKEALDLELKSDNRLIPVHEELKDLKTVWSALSVVTKSLVDMKDTLWSSIIPRKLKQQIEDLIASMKEMPSRMRQYAAYEYIEDSLKNFLQVVPLLSDLKSEAVKERHWKQIFKSLKMEGVHLSTLTVSHLWDIDLVKNSTIFNDVITIAAGEMALEEYLKQVKEIWTNYSLELVPYQNKCRLIRGWDDLFVKCAENLNSLSAMRHSPYYKVFEEDALSWEEKLNRVHMLFDVWIDVQRQWVYLEGIFTNSMEIKNLLPVETQRFQMINSEFMVVMKKVYKSPLVLDVLNIQNIQKSLESLADLLMKIQKALGEYLEKERSSFPRFYFVGDEDLLEIIGNSKDVVRMQKHFKKMFAGVCSIVLNEEVDTILGFSSKEGETVELKNQISIKDNPRINDWLTLVEREMKVTLALLLADSLSEIEIFYSSENLENEVFLNWIDKYPSQLVVLAMQIIWTQTVEATLHEAEEKNSAESLNRALLLVERGLNVLADMVLTDLSPIKRKKCEHLITELVHQRDVIRDLFKKGVKGLQNFNWLYLMRFYFDKSVQDPLKRLTVKMANATFFYGYEYHGVCDRLVQTPLTDRCYLTLTQALDSKLGGSPFGPAGTGKTESVKALGVQLGRFVLVFCCDEKFDFQAMGRIFIGLSQVGAWGCFDEFNRLEERILSAVSQQIQTIQLGLKGGGEVEVVNKLLKVNQDTGIFITMNPGYAGRSNLPDNLKKLFRSMAMTKPDRELISQVNLYSLGFRTAELMASKVVPFFNLCSEQLSSQSHYDFGLRSLKSVLVSAGNLKRDRLQKLRRNTDGKDNSAELKHISEGVTEQEILIQSIRETLVPKLVADDIPLLKSLLADVFPGINYIPVDLDTLKETVSKICKERLLVDSILFMEKVIQLYQIQNIHHGLMMVGPSGSGKSVAWRVLLEALEKIDGTEGVHYVIDPKAVSKESLYGNLDMTTREWTDGLFTSILRKIIDNVRGESTKRHWVIFDGDVDPEWVENLNSVLDDNKLLTLPNGERLSLPSNVRIMFEVDTLKYATLATVSRCGMVWFSDDVVSLEMLFENYLLSLKSKSLEDVDEEIVGRGKEADSTNAETMRTQKEVSDILRKYFYNDNLIGKVLKQAFTLEHIMDFTTMRAITTLFSLLNKTVRNILDYNTNHMDFPMSNEQLDSYVSKRLILSLVWSFAGDTKLERRAELGNYISSIVSINLPSMSNTDSIIDYDVNIVTGEWYTWQSKVPVLELSSSNSITASDIVIPTVDTIRHEEVLYSWLSEHKPLMLCGPPGSGKTMTLFAALRKLPDMEVVDLNFSSATTPELVLRTLEQYCEYRKTPNGVVLSPTLLGRWLVLFCDEINLPALDKYGTQRITTFLRQLVEQGGYWRTTDKTWVKMERIQFVGACNPPTDPGRVPLTHRFLRHAPLIMVDYPGQQSLVQIYGTFSKAMLKLVPNLRGYSDALTQAMVEFYLLSQKRFTPDIQAHYIYSPRELTRWVRGIFEVLNQDEVQDVSLESLVRIWAHEALRLFQDRLVTEEERRWTDEKIDELALKYFPNINKEEALIRPILFSDWMSKVYVPVEQKGLRELVKSRSKAFYEEELDTPLVLFDDVLEHCLRINRVFRQVQGHLLLIGVSGSGKTTLSRFVAWMKGFSIFQVKAHNKYTVEDFDDDLRGVLKRAGCKGEKIVFIMDESNVLDTGFLERMNTLLANGEVPGLFEGDEHSSLMSQCREGMQRDGFVTNSSEEIYKWFTKQVMRNLHVVFTMNPPQGGLASRAATSPALFNRCVLDWFGDWADQAFYQVGREFTDTLDLDKVSYEAPHSFPIVYKDLSLPVSYRSAVINAFVHVHQSLYEFSSKLSKRQSKHVFITPRHYLDFINHYVRLYNEKRRNLEEQQRHLNVGVAKLRDTVSTVNEMRASLAIKKTELETKNQQANEKLKKMVADQQEAEVKKTASVKLQAAIAKQNIEIEERRKVVLGDLSEAEPAVLAAQTAVNGIKKQQLTEVRSMGNPPAGVKLAMESVCTLLGHKIENWKSVVAVIRKDDFIASIVSYNTDKLTDKIRNKVRADYLNNPDFNFESINRASKACGPLVQWVIAQVKYSEILEKVGPLRAEVQQLEDDAKKTEEQSIETEKLIISLEESIGRYKDEYAILISETQVLKSEMEKVKFRVDRSMALLKDLSSESERWDVAIQSFSMQMDTIVGDVLICAAFLAYAGYFDQQYRSALIQNWSAHLQKAGILFKQDLSIPDYLSNAEERLTWQSNSLPSDNLCVENAIMIKQFNRYPLIIDPSGQATQFLKNEYRDKRIAVTSFLDDSFLKVLESALRFGSPLIVQDVENLDPILNPVLNKELRKTGGRVLIKLGGQDIDFSPSFTLFLTTRDPSVNFPPDICSRVTFVNFTVTRGSLQSQCLHQVLKAERPDVDKKRTDLVKLQGEFQLRLRQLEKSLLQALNDSKGNILEDDNIITTLETLKREASEISSKVEETDVIMEEVEQVTATYTPLSQACSFVYFTMEQLGYLHHFYQFSLEFFLEIFQFILHDNPNLKNVTDFAERLKILVTDLFNVSFSRSSRALLHEDHLTFALRLAQVKLKSTPDQILDVEYEYLLSSGSALNFKNSHPDIPALTELFGEETAVKIVELSRLGSFRNITEQVLKNIDIWKALILDKAEPDVPLCWVDAENEKSTIITAFRKLLVIKTFRPDQVLSSTTSFINSVFTPAFIAQPEMNLQTIVLEEVKCSTPVAFCSVPGYDASYLAENLANDLGINVTSVAMGSAEGFGLAETAISAAVKRGNWVLLKNVHLAPAWLTQLEKRLHSLKPDKKFRLLLTMETNPKVPISLISQSRVLMFEPLPGIKANMQQTLSSIPTSMYSKGPSERVRLYFLLAWLYAIIQERLRYAPLGWTKVYEFNDSDHNMAILTVDNWLNKVAQGRSNIAPTQIPWEALRTLIRETVYGGKIDNEFDQKVLDSFVNVLFTPESYEINFNLVDAVDSYENLLIPEGTKMTQFIEWVKKLPDRQPPHWLGLPSNAEKVLAASKGRQMLLKVRKMSSLSLEEDEGTENEKATKATVLPSWMRTLTDGVNSWAKLLPETLSQIHKTSDSIKNPLFRFFERENFIASSLLKEIRKDLTNLSKVCSGELKQTNHLRSLISSLTKGAVPEQWIRYKVPSYMTVDQFIMNLKERLEQIETISKTGNFESNKEIWIGGLFLPEAYITASRQFVAQKNQWSLEELILTLEFGKSDKPNEFTLKGLSVEGAELVDSKLKISNSSASTLGDTKLCWNKGGEEKKQDYLYIPVYLNKDRTEILFTAAIPSKNSSMDLSLFIQRGVAFVTTQF